MKLKTVCVLIITKLIIINYLFINKINSILTDTINATVDNTKKTAEEAKAQALKAAEDAKEKARVAAEAAKEEAKRAASK